MLGKDLLVKKKCGGLGEAPSPEVFDLVIFEAITEAGSLSPERTRNSAEGIMCFATDEEMLSPKEFLHPRLVKVSATVSNKLNPSLPPRGELVGLFRRFDRRSLRRGNCLHDSALSLSGEMNRGRSLGLGATAR